MKRRPGPPPQPTALRALRGNPSKTPMPKREPTPTPGSVGAPAWLDPTARAIWDELAPELHRLGLLTQLDVQALAGACRWWAVYRKADTKLKHALTADTRSNGRQALPEVNIAAKAHAAAMTVLARFGVTPAERTRLQTPEAHGDNDAAETILRRREQIHPA